MGILRAMPNSTILCSLSICAVVTFVIFQLRPSTKILSRTSRAYTSFGSRHLHYYINATVPTNFKKTNTINKNEKNRTFHESHGKISNLNGRPPAINGIKSYLTKDKYQPSRSDNLPSMTADLKTAAKQLAILPPYPAGSFPVGARAHPPTFDSKRKLLYCLIPKNNNSQMKALFCLTYYTLTGFVRTRKDPMTVHNIKSCDDYHRRFALKLTQKQRDTIWADPGYQKWSIVRNPFDRFISGFIDICVRSVRKDVIKSDPRLCHGCRGNLTCFVKANQAALKAESLQDPSSYQKRSATDQWVYHFYPQYWFCDFQGHLPDYKLLYYNSSEAFKRNLRDELLAVDWPERLVTRGWGKTGEQPFLGVTTAHKTNVTQRLSYLAQLTSDIHLTNIIFETYFVDFLSLQFDLPHWVLDLCGSTADSQQYPVCKWGSKLCKFDKRTIYGIMDGWLT